MYTLFQYSYIDIGGFDGSKVCGFSFNLGSEWNDLGYCRLRRDGSVFDSCTFPMKRGWYKEFKAILEKLLSILMALGNTPEEVNGILDILKSPAKLPSSPRSP